MLGFIIRAFEGFLRDTYGDALWLRVARGAALPFDRFEPMLRYDPALLEAVIGAACGALDRPRDSILEDVGTYLVSHPKLERLRRLLRFGGVDFLAFVHSLEDLPERAHLALPDMDLPRLSLTDLGAGRFTLACDAAASWQIVGIGHVMTGLLRAMADDYGALALIDHQGQYAGSEVVALHLLDQRHARGRAFDLTALLAG